MAWESEVCSAVAPQSETPLTTTSLRLVAQCFKAPPDRGDPAETSVEDLMSGVTLQILEHGYVLLVQTGASGQPLAPSTGRMTLARTTREGTIVKIEEREIDGSPPEDPAREVKFPPGHEYACFWTFENRKKLFRDVLSAVKKDAVGALKTHPFFKFRVEPTGFSWKRVDRLRPFLDIDPLPRTRTAAIAALLFHDTAGRFDDVIVHGVFSGGGNLWAELACAVQKPGHEETGTGTVLEHTDDKPPPDDYSSGLLRSVGVLGRLDPRAAYVVARADCIAALYVAEILTLESERARRSAFEDWTVFEG